MSIAKPPSDRLYEALKSEGGPPPAVLRSPSQADAIDLRSQAGLLSQALQAGSGERASRLEQLQAFQRIEAPFEGVVTARNIDVGALIAKFHEASQGELADDRVLLTP